MADKRIPSLTGAIPSDSEAGARLLAEDEIEEMASEDQKRRRKEAKK